MEPEKAEVFDTVMDKTARIIFTVMFFACFGVYLYTLCPSIAPGDSGEFCASGVTLALPHSPGYPLYCLLGKVFTAGVPFGNYAYRVNILSAFFSALAVVVLGIFIMRVTGCSYASVCSMFAAFTGVYWHSAVQAEVFGLNAFFAAMVLYCMLRITEAGKKNISALRWYYLSAFLFGLGLGNHQTLVFLGPAFMYVFWTGLVKRIGIEKSIRHGIVMVLFLLLGLSVYLYLPVRSVKNPGLDWGNPETLRGIWRVFSRADYGSMKLTVGEKMESSGGVLFAQLKRMFTTMGAQFSVMGLLLGFAGIYFGLKKHAEIIIVVLVMWLVSGPGFILLANMPFDAQSEGIFGRFYVMTGLFWTVFIAMGLRYLVYRRFPVIAGGITVLAVILTPLGLNRGSSDWRDHYLAYDYGRNILRTLPEGSVFFMDGGDDTFYSMAYLCFAEGRRKDVELHDRGGLVFRNVYGDDFRRLPKEQKEKRRQRAEREYLGKRPVLYSTFNRDIMPGVGMKPNGVLYEAGGKGLDAWRMYPVARSIGRHYHDYRSRALVPLYTFFRGINLQDEEEALKYLSHSYRNWPEVVWLRNNLALEYHNMAYGAFSSGRLETAKEIYGRILEIKESDYSAMTNLGVIEEKQGNNEGAKELYRKVIGINPDYAEAYYNLGVLCWKDGNWREVVRNFRQVLRIDPRHRGALRYLPQAEMRLRSGK